VIDVRIAPEVLGVKIVWKPDAKEPVNGAVPTVLVGGAAATAALVLARLISRSTGFSSGCFSNKPGQEPQDGKQIAVESRPLTSNFDQRAVQY